MSDKLDIDGHKIAVTTLGDGPRPMVMIHCSLANHRSLARLARHFANTHTVQLIDMPGHGDSGPWDGQADIQGLVATAAARVADPGSLVFGHSFGGAAALRFAVERPDLVSALALYEPVYFTPPIGTPEYNAYLTRFQPYVDAMAADDPPAAAEAFNRLWGLQPWDTLPAFVRRDMAARIWFILASERAFEGDVGGVFAPGRLEALTLPVAILHGDTSEPIIPPVANAIAARLANVQVHALDGIGHMGPITDPDRVAEIVRGLVAG